MGGSFLIVGISFIIIGIFIYGNEIYSIKTIKGERVIERKERPIKNQMYRYKMMVSILSFVLGTFRIISSIIY